MRNRATAALIGALAAAVAFTALPSWAESPDQRDVVRTRSNDIVRNTFGNCVRTRWMAGQDYCSAAPRVPERVSRARQLRQQERTVYFEFNRSRLLASEQRKLESLAGILRADQDVKGVRIVGYADRIGTTAYNERLSRERAKTVESYLRQRGYLKTELAKTRWLGESSPRTQCSDSLPRAELIACLQPDRRVEVEIDFYDDVPPAARPGMRKAPR